VLVYTVLSQTILKAEGDKRISGHNYGDKALKIRTLSKILKQVKVDKNTDDRRKFKIKKTICTASVFLAVTTEFEADTRFASMVLPRPIAHEMAPFIPFFRRFLGFQGRVLDGVPKSSQKQIEKRVESSTALVKMITEKRRRCQGLIIAMDKSVVSMSIPETKDKSIPCLEKGNPGSTKDKG
jgi:hypothetical protein